ncbi:class I SAM-dependent methyltransferase [Crocosphaera sp. XPORK-15E]|uniref:class I SAM-dependent methyltransferase n=1 Tax=Crocosphaera sp. XPORK-15E TaxID=3110247 RepID=UPI002B200200|nr:methyltransferase domain-containing protein [Crocosphaera sp. XPORK-15E]MEA5533055.1 methyltransferase domain-containing protein [Crocosphaera sp. XPORK-15E]
MTEQIFDQKASFFDRWAPNYDVLFTTIFYQSIHKRLLSYVSLPHPSQVLDLGCGTGRLLNRLAAQFPDLQGTGVDLSPQMLKEARHNNQHHPRLIYTKGNAESLPFANNQFDAVFNTISFLHYPNPEQVFSEVSRILRPQGQFYLADSTMGNIRSIPFSPGGIRFYSPQQRENYAKNVGLECIGHYYLLERIILSLFRKPDRP